MSQTAKIKHPAWSHAVFTTNYITRDGRYLKTIDDSHTLVRTFSDDNNPNEVVRVRYRIIKGGRASSKSWEVARRLILKSIQQPLLILCTRELQKSIKDSVHKLLINQVHLMGLEHLFEWDKTQLKSKIGSEFLFYGLRYNSEEIKSTEGIDICWLEEAQKTKEDSLIDLFPTIRKEGSEIWATYNPKDSEDPINERFVNNHVENAIVSHVNYNDNPWLAEVSRIDMEQMKRDNYKLYERVWLGKIVELGDGDYFPSDKANIIDVCPDVLRSCRAWDLAATAPSDNNPDPDYTAGVKIGITSDGKIIIMNAKAEQFNANDVRNLVRSTAESEPHVLIRIPQDPAQAGKEQAESYKRMLSDYNVKTLRVSGDKETRAEALSAQWQAGNVYIVKGSWNKQYIKMMNAFPTKEIHDDVVDASSDAFSEIIEDNSYNLSASL